MVTSSYYFFCVLCSVYNQNVFNMNSLLGNYRRLNTLIGWVLFVISSTVYILTVEPTVSFWDCGEFILSAFKLQVGHPPGAPLFLMIGRIATLFAGGNTLKVAVTMNILSALCSGFAIMFLFWTITHLVRKVLTNGKTLELKALSCHNRQWSNRSHWHIPFPIHSGFRRLRVSYMHSHP